MAVGDAITLGRLELMAYPAKVREVLTRAGLNADLFAPDAPQTGFAEPVFKALGARSITSLDFSDYEGAGVVHDLNQPIGENLREKYDLVYDGGTLEHVFNFPTALKNCMEMVRADGRLVIHTCANNWCGHGFYQFSPELFYNVLSEDNGYEVERMILHVVGPYNRWYEVANPKDIRSRVELYNWAAPLQMLVLARRKKVVPIFAKTPQQSDYVPMWEEKTSGAKVSTAEKPSALVRYFPGLARLKRVVKAGYNLWHGNSLGNRVKFKPVSKWD